MGMSKGLYLRSEHCAITQLCPAQNSFYVLLPPPRIERKSREVKIY